MTNSTTVKREQKPCLEQPLVALDSPGVTILYRARSMFNTTTDRPCAVLASLSVLHLLRTTPSRACPCAARRAQRGAERPSRKSRPESRAHAQGGKTRRSNLRAAHRCRQAGEQLGAAAAVSRSCAPRSGPVPARSVCVGVCVRPVGCEFWQADVK